MDLHSAFTWGQIQDNDSLHLFLLIQQEIICRLRLGSPGHHEMYCIKLYIHNPCLQTGLRAFLMWVNQKNNLRVAWEVNLWFAHLQESRWLENGSAHLSTFWFMVHQSISTVGCSHVAMPKWWIWGLKFLEFNFTDYYWNIAWLPLYWTTIYYSIIFVTNDKRFTLTLGMTSTQILVWCPQYPWQNYFHDSYVRRLL